MNTPKITVFTPTYNRAYILPKLYKSLRRQKSTDFEWIIIDDGSSDNTEMLVKGWKAEHNSFNITYERTKNGGKHRAINRGVKLSKASLFFIVDSDDYLTDNAISSIVKMSETLPEDRSEFAGISGTCISPDNSLIGEYSTDSNSFIDATNLERDEKSLTGDKAEVYFTEVLKQHPFPTIKGETFLSEEIVWDAIARDGLKIRWFNTPLKICEYREDGLSKNILEIQKRNPKGFALYIKNKLLKTHGVTARLRTLYSYYLPMQGIQNDKEIQIALDISYFKLLALKTIKTIKRD